MKFKCRFYEIELKQSPPNPAWVELTFSTESYGTEFRFMVQPEDFIQFVDSLVSFSKYSLKDSNGEKELWK